MIEQSTDLDHIMTMIMFNQSLIVISILLGIGNIFLNIAERQHKGAE